MWRGGVPSRNTVCVDRSFAAIMKRPIMSRDVIINCMQENNLYMYVLFQKRKRRIINLQFGVFNNING